MELKTLVCLEEYILKVVTVLLQLQWHKDVSKVRVVGRGGIFYDTN